MEWISVNDRMPESEEGEFLVIEDHGKGYWYYVGYLEKGQWYNEHTPLSNITHWMTLPARPKHP